MLPAVIVAALLLTSCATMKPVPHQPDTYSFTVQAVMVTPEGLSRQAEEVAEEFMAENGYASYEILHSSCLGGSCAYTVRYVRHTTPPEPGEIRTGMRVTVGERGARVRVAPHSEAELLGTLRPGDRFAVRGIVDDSWARIALVRGRMGYVHISELRPAANLRDPSANVLSHTVG